MANTCGICKGPDPVHVIKKKNELVAICDLCLHTISSRLVVAPEREEPGSITVVGPNGEWLRGRPVVALIAEVDAEDAAAQATMPPGLRTCAWWQGWGLDPKTAEAVAPERFRSYRLDLEKLLRTPQRSCLYWLTHLSVKVDEFKVQGFMRLLHDVFGYDWHADGWTKKRLRDAIRAWAKER